MANHLLLCETVVSKLSVAKRDIQNLLVFLNMHVLKIHYQVYEQERLRDHSGNQDMNPPQIKEMKNALAKMDVKLPELQETLERGDRSLLLVPVSEAFAEQPRGEAAVNNVGGNNLRRSAGGQESNETSR